MTVSIHVDAGSRRSPLVTGLNAVQNDTPSDRADVDPVVGPCSRTRQALG
jgi:hypothetical protein